MSRILFPILVFFSLLPDNMCQEKILNYYFIINKANDLIFQNKIDSALIIYSKAFEYNNEPPVIDLINYAKLLQLKGKYIDFQGLLHYLNSEKGVNPKTLKNFFNLENKLYEKFHKKNESSKKYSKELFETFLGIYEEDQAYRPKIPKYTKEIIEKRDSIDEVNFEKYLTLIKNYGFPSEKNLPYSLNDSINLWDINITLYIHFILSGNGKSLIKILHNEFESGNLHPAILGHCYDLLFHQTGNENFIYQTSYLTIIGAKYYRPLIDLNSKEIINSMNLRRKKIGLPSYEKCSRYFICTYLGKENNCNKMYCNFELAPYTEVQHLPFFLFKNKTKELKSYEIDFHETCD